MLSSTEEKMIRADLNKCNNVQEVFDYLKKNFKTEDCKLGMITKAPYIDGTIKAINIMNAKRR